MKEGGKNRAWAFSLHEVVYDVAKAPVDYKLVAFDPTFEKLFQVGNKQIVGQNISGWLFGQKIIPKAWQAALKEVVQTGRKKKFETVLAFNNSSYLAEAYVPFPSYLIIVFRPAQLDDSFLESGFLAPLETQRVFSQRVFDYTPNSIIIYEVQGQGASSHDYIVRSVNPAGLVVESWREEDVLGKPLGVLRPGADKFGIVEIFQQVWQTGQTMHYPAKVYEEGQEYRWFENIVFKLPTGEIVAIYDDITEEKLKEEALFAEKERLKVTLYSIGDAVIATDIQGKIELMNPIAEELTGWQQTEALGRPLTAIFNIFNEITGKPPPKNPVDVVLQTGKTAGLANHTILKAKDGKERVIQDSAAPIRDLQGNILGVILVFRDVTKAREKEARIEFLSYRDSLTGLYNRTFIEDELKRLDSKEHYPLSLIMGDLDGLKLINDAFGHQTGDEALLKMAHIIRASCGSKDVISRWGGDEFLILLPNTTEKKAESICQQIKGLAAATKIATTELSISLGFATKTNETEKRAELLRRVENNMYKAKLLGAKSYRNVVLSSIEKTLFEKSFETEEHGKRMGFYCRRIGEILGLSAPQLDELEVFSMLHDIGKIGIDEQILRKPGPLTEKEWEIIRTHPEIGHRIAQTVPELLNIAEYILAHHERWDGTGYPKGLAGEQIPLLARILSVVDAYDAMTNDRSYRRALTPAAARAELLKNAGTQFDPQIVSVFLAYLEKEPDPFN